MFPCVRQGFECIFAAVGGMGATTSLLEQLDDRQRFLHERHAGLHDLLQPFSLSYPSSQ